MAQTKPPQTSDTSQDTPQTPTFLSEDSRVVGHIEGAEDLRVLGEVDGSIVLQNADLFIEPSAIVSADLQARNVLIAGAVVGNIAASQRVVLKPGARVVGDIRAPRLSVAEGSAYRGALETADPSNLRDVAQTQTHAASPSRTASRPARRVERESTTVIESARAVAPSKHRQSIKKAPKKRAAPRMPIRGKHKIARS